MVDVLLNDESKYVLSVEATEATEATEVVVVVVVQASFDAFEVRWIIYNIIVSRV